MAEFAPERVMAILKGKEIQIVAVQNARLYIYWHMAKDMDAFKEFERRRVRARKDKGCKVQMVEALKKREKVQKFIQPIHDFVRTKVMGQKIKLEEEE